MDFQGQKYRADVARLARARLWARANTEIFRRTGNTPKFGKKNDVRVTCDDCKGTGKIVKTLEELHQREASYYQVKCGRCNGGNVAILRVQSTRKFGVEDEFPS